MSEYHITGMLASPALSYTELRIEVDSDDYTHFAKIAISSDAKIIISFGCQGKGGLSSALGRLEQIPLSDPNCLDTLKDVLMHNLTFAY
jgi:hypothetical protein